MLVFETILAVQLETGTLWGFLSTRNYYVSFLDIFQAHSRGMGLSSKKPSAKITCFVFVGDGKLPWPWVVTVGTSSKVTLKQNITVISSVRGCCLWYPTLCHFPAQTKANEL